jgi:hypothetical protein
MRHRPYMYMYPDGRHLHEAAVVVVARLEGPRLELRRPHRHNNNEASLTTLSTPRQQCLAPRRRGPLTTALSAVGDPPPPQSMVNAALVLSATGLQRPATVATTRQGSCGRGGGARTTWVSSPPRG